MTLHARGPPTMAVSSSTPTRCTPGGVLLDRALHDAGHPLLDHVEVGYDAHPRHQSQTGDGITALADVGNVSHQGDRAGGTAGHRRACLPGFGDGGADTAAHECRRQVRGITAGQVDKTGRGDRGGQLRGLGAGSVEHQQGAGLNSEAAVVRLTEPHPVRDAVGSLQRRRRGQEHHAAGHPLQECQVDALRRRGELAAANQPDATVQRHRPRTITPRSSPRGRRGDAASPRWHQRCCRRE